ncbi:uncharacterized protein [Littorina saxatilis]|uniref:uncharacterized protein n=1 Tax=Littorina saxatilis TaxID=31220 RepID=UPI0038B4DC22
MAVSLNGSRRGGRRQLICGVCRDVYRSPRFLPCHHSFCSHCLEDLVTARGGRPFPCPACRRTTPVPSGGASGFQSNFYLDEEDLELARKGPGTILCSVHDMTPLEFMCVQCDQAICIKCRLTKHMHHEAEDLSEAAARSQDRLETVKVRLEGTINFLTKQAEEADTNHKAAIEKGKLLEGQVKVQHDALVARVVRQRDLAVKEIKQSNAKVVEKLSADAQNVKQEVDSLLQLQQRVHHALNDASDAEKVHTEKEICEEGQSSVEQLKRAESSVPDTTVRPGLHYDQSAVSDDDIRRFLGSPVKLSLPCGPVLEVVVPIYQCGQEGACREVHSVCHGSDQLICLSFGGTLPDYAGETQIGITDKGDMKKIHPEQKNKKVTFVKFADGKLTSGKHDKTTNFTLYAKHEILILLISKDIKTRLFEKLTILSTKPFTTTKIPLFNINSEHTVACDATKDEQLFVVIEEKATGHSQKAEYNVRLFHRGQRDPFTTYQPPDAGFHPTDVCFWQEDGWQKLLVADAQNDSVHVVNVEEDACLFERYLAAGNGHLVRPTALNVDDRNRVWIGCGNGWILRCEKLQEPEKLPDDDGDGDDDDDDDEDDDDSNASVRSVEEAGASDTGLLMVENLSHSTDARSQLSEDSE